jgi:hypothetical protein
MDVARSSLRQGSEKLNKENKEFGLRRPHAVGPDIGTSTLLFTAAKHPGLLRSIVIFRESFTNKT